MKRVPCDYKYNKWIYVANEIISLIVIFLIYLCIHQCVCNSSLSLSNIKLCSITLRLSDPYCQTLNVRFHNGSFRYDSFQSGSLVSVIIMTGFRQHLNWTTKMCDHVILLSNSGWTVHSMPVPCPFHVRSAVRSSLIQSWFWLWKKLKLFKLLR